MGIITRKAVKGESVVSRKVREKVGAKFPSKKIQIHFIPYQIESMEGTN